MQLRNRVSIEPHQFASHSLHFLSMYHLRDDNGEETAFFVASWTGVVKFHGPQPSMRLKQVFVCNHTSMIDFIILEQVTAFAVIMQKHSGWVGSIPTLVVSSADMAREIFKTRHLAFSGWPVLYAAKKFSYNCSNVSFAPYGEYWRKLRKIAVLELLSAKRV
ncbi:hypothetical protein ACSBR1_024406 [Camellia fascicularis]